MKLTIVGIGYVGLVTAVCFADKGHDVTCIDIDKYKIELLNRGISPIFEQDIDELLKKNSVRMRFTTDYKMAYKEAEVIFIAVGTPEKKDGSANLAYVFDAAKQIAQTIEKNCIIIIKSTVPIGTNDKIEKIINENKLTDIKTCVVSNPEFLSQGTAIKDTLQANRIIIGVNDKRATETLNKIYKDFNAPILITDRRSAEMIKYASNDFLALKISYINEIANLCEIVGANVEDVAKGMGYDNRIGDKFLNAGLGYGGSCFPKDTKALHWLGNMNNYEIKTIKAAIEVNEQQKLKLIKKARKYYDSFEGLSIAVLGLTFKPGTDDLREAPSLVNIPILLDEGAKVKAYDPIGIENFKRAIEHCDDNKLDNIEYCNNIDDTIKDTDICFILTEWNEIKNYDISKFRKLMKKAIVLDGRNCFSLKKIKEADILYEGIGR